jgi:heme O synthase-like polyprenyltransferase
MTTVNGILGLFSFLFFTSIYLIYIKRKKKEKN